MSESDAIEILLVEDDPLDAELTMRGLSKNNLANKIVIASDGEEALDFFSGKGRFKNRDLVHSPCLILLDLKLPKISGLEVLKALKSDEKTSRIPVVVLTSSREEPDIEAAYTLGANSYVVKPVNFTKFISAMCSISLYWLLINEPRK